MRLKEILRIFLQKIVSDKETVDYVCGAGDALPLPLSAEEESAALRGLESEQEKEKAKDNTVMKAIFFALLVGIIVVVIWFLTYKQESHTSSNVGESDYSALECTASDPSEPFFAFENTQEVAHTIKYSYKAEINDGSGNNNKGTIQ